MATLADEALARRVEEAIGFDPRVTGSDVRVEVRDGIALLEGIVSGLDAKRAAGDAASRIAGVRRVDNVLTVEDPRGLPDAEINEAVEEALVEDPAVDAREVGARVTDGVAHLVGHVDSAADEEEAVRAASRAEGVKEIVSEIDVSPGRDMDWVDIRNAVTDALGAAADLQPYTIDVAVETGGRVVLSGSVPDQDARSRAMRVASGADGVKGVVDRLTVGP